MYTCSKVEAIEREKINKIITKKNNEIFFNMKFIIQGYRYHHQISIVSLFKVEKACQINNH